MLLWLEFSLMYLITPCRDLSFWEAPQAERVPETPG